MGVILNCFFAELMWNDSVTRRNDSRLNNHQQVQLQGWRANCDIQLVIDHCACVEYLTKYAAKGEPRSPILKQALNSIVQNVDSSTDPHRVIKKVVMKSIGEREENGYTKNIPNLFLSP